MMGQEINDPWYGDRPERFALWHMAKQVRAVWSILPTAKFANNHKPVGAGRGQATTAAGPIHNFGVTFAAMAVVGSHFDESGA